MGRPKNSPERMLARVVQVTPGCWLWKGPRTPNGYGKACIDHKHTTAHRVFYVHFNGPLQAGREVVHSCGDRLCVNPAHLKAVSSYERSADGGSPAGLNLRKTHCLRGHPLNGGNLYVTPDGRRQCRTCRRESNAARKQGRRVTNA